MIDRPRPLHRLPLNAADASLLALDRLMGPGRVGGNLVHLVIEVDGGIDPARVTRAFERFVERSPWPAARLRRGAPLLPPYWKPSPRDRRSLPPVTEHRETENPSIDRFLEQRLNDPIDPFRGPPMRCDLLPPAHDGAS
ncbi:MAG: hypothetical protein KDC38_16005, partial [Planctomycetes bacterium]|nr:hypothetical protein [Planctomycetota bacterium]